MSKAWCSPGWVKSSGLLAVLIIILAGCSLLTYKGLMVGDEYRIALADGTQMSARYETIDLTIAYQLKRSGDELELSGAAKFATRLQNNFTVISSFQLSVLFTDAEGRILADRGIVTPGSDNPNNQMRFREKLLLRPGTANMAFSYSGQGRGGGGKGGGETPFWHIPIVR